MKIKNKIIGRGNPAFIIAEAGINHNNNFNYAKLLIASAADACCDAVKFQAGENRIQYLWIPKLKEICKRNKIIFLCSVCDVESVDKIGDVAAYKIPSKKINDLKLLRYIKSKGKPIIASAGGAMLNEINTLVEKIEPDSLLQCTFEYPTTDLNLNVIPEFMKLFPKQIIGFSDHSTSLITPSIAVSLGANIIEKHFTLRQSFKGPDHKFSLNPTELKQMVTNVRETERALGSKTKTQSKKELQLRKQYTFEKTKKVVAIIQARMGSKRLPGKVLKLLGHKPVLGHIFDRLKKCERIDEIIIATSATKRDEKIEHFARKNKIKCYRGAELDVLRRLTSAAKHSDADVVVRVCADCPFIDYESVDKLIELHLGDDDIKITHNIGKLPKGTEAEVIDFELLEKYDNQRLTPYDREHVTTFIKERCLTKVLSSKKDKNHLDFRVDYPEDLDKLNVLVNCKYAIRVDGNERIGMGHISRCELIASRLDGVVFFTKTPSFIKHPNVIHLSDEEDIDYYFKNINPKYLIIDLVKSKYDYSNLCKTILLDITGEHQFKPNIHYKRSINRPTDLIIDPVFKKLKKINPEIKNILVSMGGSDPASLLLFVMNSFNSSGLIGKYNLNVVCGRGFKKELPERILPYIILHRDISKQSMASLMGECDIAIIAGGSTLYELATMGVPAISFPATKWEKTQNIPGMVKNGTVITGSIKEIPKLIESLTYERRLEMNKKGRDLIDGKGLDRFIKKIR